MGHHLSRGRHDAAVERGLHFPDACCHQQMNNINLDATRRCAWQAQAEDPPPLHAVRPGRFPRTGAAFYGALGHGMQIVNSLNSDRPSRLHRKPLQQSGDLPNHSPQLPRLGQFEDIIQFGRKRPAKAAMWFSETAIWGDNDGSFTAGKRTLYSAIIHQGTLLDFVIEGGNLKNYRVLFLADAHVSRRSEAIAAWVKAGGTLFATAGAGMFDELNQPNTVLRGVLGVSLAGLDAPASLFVGM